MLSSIIFSTLLVISSACGMEGNQENTIAPKTPIKLTEHKTLCVIGDLENLLDRKASHVRLVFKPFADIRAKVHVEFKKKYWDYIKSLVPAEKHQSIDIFLSEISKDDQAVYDWIKSTISNDMLYDRSQQIRRELLILEQITIMRAYNFTELDAALQKYLDQNPWIEQLLGTNQ